MLWFGSKCQWPDSFTGSHSGCFDISLRLRFVRNVSVGDFISDHAAIRCQLDFSHPSTSIDKWVSYRQYHRIDIDQFRNDLNNIPFVRSPEGTAAELYDQYITGVTQVHDKHAPIISRKAKQQSDEWLSDSYRMARSLRWQFE